ncbi:MAG: fatty acid cis/trans isomerase, partial [Bdellovibrio sp.]
PLLERLVYNLVVNFDVFGNVGHQLLTRVYMDMIRMEAEELFLRFLPPEQRLTYRRDWYKGLFAQAKMTYLFPTVGSAEPTAVRFTEEKQTKRQMIEKILFFHMNDRVRGSLDKINWKILKAPESVQSVSSRNHVETQLRKIAAVKAESKTPFAQYFSEFSYLKISLKGGGWRVFSVIHNREMENISWILGESLRRAPAEDSLTFYEGFAGSYPNMIFTVTERQLGRFVAQVMRIKSQEDYDKFVQTYGARRTQSRFWSHYDDLHRHYRMKEPTQFGFLDLTRYELK